MQLRVRRVAHYVTPCTTRMPFRFGMVTMNAAPLLTTKVEVECEDGRLSSGFSSDLLVPKWFEKDPSKSVAEDIDALLGSARSAAQVLLAPELREQSVFALWWHCYRQRVLSQPASSSDLLVRGFGVALMERALMDAASRASGRSFFQALEEGLFGFEPAIVLPELDGWRLQSSLPAAPLESVLLRHTVGLADPLRICDIADPDRVDDGLPQALEEDVQRYGLCWFKVKVAGRPAEDLVRLRAVAAVLEATAPPDVQWMLDGNEQYADLGELVSLLQSLAADREGARFLERLRYVEQPLPRARSFDAETARPLAELSEIAPVILDEADTGIHAFRRGIAHGYRGVSVKNCKGVFRALLNRGLCELAGEGYFQTAEDLTNLPVLALQQDLATVAALGLPHVERNGHHYFRGLDHLPEGEAKDAANAHPGLYEQAEGGVFLAIRNGRLDLRSLVCPGYGYDLEIRTAERTPLESWSPLRN